MSLTHEGYEDRKWKSSPILRKFLQEKSIPGKYYGITTSDDNYFDYIGRLDLV